MIEASKPRHRSVIKNPKKNLPNHFHVIILSLSSIVLELSIRALSLNQEVSDKVPLLKSVSCDFFVSLPKRWHFLRRTIFDKISLRRMKNGKSPNWKVFLFQEDVMWAFWNPNWLLEKLVLKEIERWIQSNVGQFTKIYFKFSLCVKSNKSPTGHLLIT